MNQTAPGSDTAQDKNLVEYHSDGNDSGRMVVKQYRRKAYKGKMITYTLLRKFGVDVPIE